MRIFVATLFVHAFSISILAQHRVETWAGGNAATFVEGYRLNARFNGPWSIAGGDHGVIYVADATNHCIRKIDAFGEVSTIAGNGTAGWRDGDSTDAMFNNPTGICTAPDGSIYVADFNNHCIRKIAPNLHVTTIAGNRTEGFADGPGAQAMFDYPRGIAINSQGELFVGDSWNHRIRKIFTDATVSTFAGGGTAAKPGSIGAWVDGRDTSARFWTPCGVAIDTAGNVLVADAFNHRIRLITPNRLVRTIAGTGASGRDSGGFRNGPAPQSVLNTPTEVSITASGDVLFSDTFGNRIRRLAQGVVSTFAGTGAAGFSDGVDTLAAMNYPRGILASGHGDTVFVCDFNNNRIRAVVPGSVNVVRSQTAPSTSLMVYPNPATASVFVQGSFTPKLLTENGALWPVRIASSGPAGMTLDLSSCPSGKYYLWGSGAAVPIVVAR